MPTNQRPTNSQRVDYSTRKPIRLKQRLIAADGGGLYRSHLTRRVS